MRIHLLLFACLSLSVHGQTQTTRLAESWQQPYTGVDEHGSDVLGCWHFDQDGKDSSGKGHDLKIVSGGAAEGGRFGGALESFEGFPKKDKMHGARTTTGAGLTPKGAFTFELWIKPKPGFATTAKAMLLDKKYVSDTDYQWSLTPPDKSGSRHAEVLLGFGDHTRTFHSQALTLKEDAWQHLAFTYDGAGRGSFFFNGRAFGGGVFSGEGSIAAGKHTLCIGERVGSNYPGCLALLDEVRITNGAREFRRGSVKFESDRFVFRRMEAPPVVRLRVQNLTRTPMKGATLVVADGGAATETFPIPEIAGGAEHVLERKLDASLRPDAYDLSAVLTFADDADYKTEDRLAYRIVARQPTRMPVMMWGIGSPDSVLKELPRLKDIGFTHCLGLGADNGAIWEAGKPVSPQKADAVEKAKRMLDEALANDFGIAASVGPSRWLEEQHREMLRVDRNGKPYARQDIVASRPELVPYYQNVGASVAQAYSSFPAWEAALISSEVRDNSQVSFSPLEVEQCRKATGADIPDLVKDKNGVLYSGVKDFPADRVVPDDHPILKFYQWWWQRGDGWNDLHTALHKGLHSTGRDDVWTWFDPAVRAPSISGSGGAVDVLGHWTYSYPDPIRIGLCADQLFAMSAANGLQQRVMKMTQIIWYRSQTSPMNKAGATPAPWEDHDPEAAYITISPEHLREALWTKIARPIKGIMYHGWQSLVPTDSVGGYRYTHPDTQHELKKLVHEVIQPLGPMLLEVPDGKNDIAFLQSFTSEMFTRKGGYGSNSGWSGDAWHITQYAHLQSDIVFDETITKRGLDGYKLLFLMDCDVLSAGVVAKIKAWQAAGGIIVGDENLCPAIMPNHLLASYKRTKKADVDHEELVKRGRELEGMLLLSNHSSYESKVSSSNPQVVTRMRTFGPTDYLFAVNDHREFGEYVGKHGLVMENGLPSFAQFSIRRQGGAHVYDLVAGREVTPSSHDQTQLSFGLANSTAKTSILGPGEGRIFMITPKAIDHLVLEATESVQRPSPAEIHVIVSDRDQQPIQAVVPIRVEIQDPNGREMEWSGYHAAVKGRLDLHCNIAANDTKGLWTIRVTELASGQSAQIFMRVQ